jgi:2-polyprenyl-6-methoxyphenol hydroxylase-like FAD-dependent oxidoreductase
MTNPYRIGIVGFGIAGGALALMVARAGHTVTLLERAPAVGPVGAGFLLQPTGQAVLKRLGLLDPITAVSEPIHAIRAYKHAGGTLVNLQHAEVLPGRHAYGVHRGLLFETLHTAVEQARVNIQIDQTITSWRSTTQGIWAVTEKGSQHGPFDFLVAADGARSQLRQRLNPGLQEREYEFGALWLVGRGTQVRGYLHQITKGTQNLLGLLPIGNEQCALFWLLKRNEMDGIRQRGFTAWRNEVIRYSPLAEETLTGITSFDQAVFTGYRHVQPSRLYNEEVVCIGDAAHASSPHLGQGANMALLDAEALTQALAATPTPQAAFQHYVRQRRGQIRYYATLSYFLTPFFQANGPWLGLGRDIGLPLMFSIPPIRWQMELAMTGVKTGWLSPDYPLP